MNPIQHYDQNEKDWGCFHQNQDGFVCCDSFHSDAPSWIAKINGSSEKYGFDRTFLNPSKAGRILNLGHLDEGFYEFRNVPLNIADTENLITGFFHIRRLELDRFTDSFLVIRNCTSAEVSKGIDRITAPWYQSALTRQSELGRPWTQLEGKTWGSVMITIDVLASSLWGVYMGEKSTDGKIIYSERVAPLDVGSPTKPLSPHKDRTRKVTYRLTQDNFYFVSGMIDKTIPSNYGTQTTRQKVIYVTPNDTLIEVSRRIAEEQLDGIDPYLSASNNRKISNQANYYKVKHRATRG